MIKLSAKPMMVRRYRVGVDLNKYARNFIIGCVLTALVSIAVVAFILLTAFESKWNEMTENYESEIRALETKLRSIEAEHEEEIKTIRADYEKEINARDETIAELTDKYAQLSEMKEQTFEFYKDYWYIFRDAPAGKGITLELIAYVDELCQQWDVNPQWMWAIYDLETGMNPKLDNAAGSGARGLGQVMPGTGKNIWEKILKKGTYTHSIAYDPFVNVEITVTHIGRNIAIGSMSNAIELYSGGGGSSYYNTVIQNGQSHGYTLTESNAHYPWQTK